jgi:hypothetical protein
LERLGVEEEAGSAPEDLGRRAALLVGAEHAWDQHIGPMLGAEQMAGLLGVGTRQAIHDRARRGGLIALRRGSRQVRFPAFQLVDQLGSTAKTVLPELGHILRVFADAGVDTWTTASWFCTPAALLESMTPAGWLATGKDPQRVVEAAQRSAARLGQ